MKRLSLIFSIICLIFVNSLFTFAAANEGFEELSNEISNGVFTGTYFTSAGSTIAYSESSKWKKIDSNIEYDCDMRDEFDYFINQNATSTKPVWIEYAKNEWYLVTATEKVTYTDENDKIKTVSGWYSITDIIESGVVVINNKAYYFEEGVCANNGSAITSNKGVVTFKGKNVDKNFEVEIDIEQCNLDVYEYDEVLDKDSNKKLYNGYWILDKGNEKYDLYQANGSGSSSKVNGATNKSAYELYTIINNKNYTKAAGVANKNSTINTNNKTSINMMNNNTQTNNTTTTTKSSGNKLSTSLNKSDYSFKVVNGSLQLVLNNNYKFVKEGTYYNNGYLVTIDSNGKQTAKEEGSKGSYTDITNLKVYSINIDNIIYWVTKE